MRLVAEGPASTSSLATAGRLESLPAWLLAILVAVVPIASANLTGLGLGQYPLLYDTIALPRLVVTAVIGSVAWVMWLWSAARFGWPVRVDVVWTLLVVLAVWAVVSAAASPHWALAVLGQSERLEGVVTVAGYALLYGVALQAVRGTVDARRIASGLGVGATIVAVHGLLQWAGLDPTSYALEAYGFDLRAAFASFGNPNFLAGLLVLALPVLVSLALTADDHSSRIAWSIGAAAVALALFATMTRGAWIAVLVELVVLAAIWHRKGARIKPYVVRALAAALVVLVAASAISLAKSGEARSFADRVAIIASAGGAVAVRPIFGYGPDAFLPAFRANRSEESAARFGSDFTMNNAHSWPLQYAATLGLPGAILLTAAIGVALWRARGVGFGSGAGPGSHLLTGMLVGCLGFVVHMLMSVATVGATTPFWVLLGVLGGSSARSLRVPCGSLWFGFGLLALIAAVLTAVSACLIVADGAYLSSRLAFRTGALTDATRLADRAVRLNPLSIKYARGRAELFVRATRSAIEGELPVVVVRAKYARADRELGRVLLLDNSDYPALAWRAALQADVSEYVDDPALARAAAETARRAASLDRQHAELRALTQGDSSPSAAAMARDVPPLP